MVPARRAAASVTRVPSRHSGRAADGGDDGMPVACGRALRRRRQYETNRSGGAANERFATLAEALNGAVPAAVLAGLEAIDKEARRIATRGR